MTAHVYVVSATKDEIESDITIIGSAGEPLAVFTGFVLRSLSASSRLSPEGVDRGLYEIQWAARPESQNDRTGTAAPPDSLSWLIFLDNDGVGTALADQLRRSGHRVRAVLRQPVNALTKIDGGYALNARRPEQLQQLIDIQLHNAHPQLIRLGHHLVKGLLEDFRFNGAANLHCFGDIHNSARHNFLGKP